MLSCPADYKQPCQGFTHNCGDLADQFKDMVDSPIPDDYECTQARGNGGRRSSGCSDGAPPLVDGATVCLPVHAHCTARCPLQRPVYSCALWLRVALRVSLLLLRKPAAALTVSGREFATG